jgi:hypothetical protein
MEKFVVSKVILIVFVEVSLCSDGVQFGLRHFGDVLINDSDTRISGELVLVANVEIPIQAVERARFFTIPFLFIVIAIFAVIAHFVYVIG